MRRGIARMWTVALVLAVSLVGNGMAETVPKVMIDEQGCGFRLSDGKSFIPIGVNYFRPGTGWAPQLWKQFDPEATRKDFQRMKEYGVNCVRVFLTYGSFYTQKNVLNPEGLAKFDQFLSLAEEFGIYVHPTGPDHWEGLPEFAQRDRTVNDDVLEALESFWKLFVSRYKGRSIIFAYDLLNEPAVPWESPLMEEKWNRWLQSRYQTSEAVAQAWSVKSDQATLGAVPIPSAESSHPRALLDYQQFREELAEVWTRRQVEAIKAADPDALVTVGLIQWSVPVGSSGVRQYSGFRPERIAHYLDFLEIHFYPLATGFYEYRSEEDEIANLAYLESVVREVARPGKPVVLAEFGWYGGGQLTINRGIHPPASEQLQARWCEQAIRTTRPFCCGWLNWGLYDHPEARDVSQLTGLFKVDGQPKAWANVFRRLSETLSQEKCPCSGKTLEDQSRPQLDWDQALVDMAYLKEYRERYLQQFREYYVKNLRDGNPQSENKSTGPGKDH